MNTDQVNQETSEQGSFGVVQHNLTNIFPTASEIGNIWASYLAENMSVCMLKFMVAKSKDPDIKPILQQALDISSQRVKSLEDLFNAIHHPIPEGFSEKDVDNNAPELFSESFSLSYTRLMNIYVGMNYSLALSRCSRSDFRQFFSDGINTSREINQRATDVLLAKGLLLKAPHIIIPDRTEKVNDKKYYGSIFRNKRPLNAIEVSHIYHNAEIRFMLSTLQLGFSQVIKSEKVRNHLYRGKKIHNEHAKILAGFLQEEDLPVPNTAEFQVTNSKQSPFSDKLMMFHSTVVTSFSIIENGFSLTNSARKDVISAFNRLIIEMLEYSKDGTDLMIENGWLEKVPETADRKELIQ
jgi:hypothetical protein